MPGSEVSPGYLLEDCNVQGLLCNQLLQPLVFFLNLFEPFGLVDLQPSVLPPPAVVGVLADPKMPAYLTNALALGEEDFGLAQVVDDLFICESSSRHENPLSGLGRSLSHNPDRI